MSVLILPLLPNATFGPLQVLNPFTIGLMMALIAGGSFVGYVAIRILGAGRGLAVTALIGGLVSSTAVTLAAAGRARREPELAPAAALAIVLASTIMSARIMFEVAVVYRPLISHLLPPVGAMFVVGIAASLLLYRRSKASAATLTPSEVTFQNPFELGSAIKSGLLFALVLLGAKAAQLYAGTKGIYVAALFAGTTDVDAITLSTANLARGGLPVQVAVTTIVLGATANSIVKGSMAVVVGGVALARPVLGSFAAMIVAGGLGIVLTWLKLTSQ